MYYTNTPPTQKTQGGRRALSLVRQMPTKDEEDITKHTGR